MTDTAGNVVKSYQYDAFGNEKNIDANDTNPFRYSSEYFDKETGTIYLRARYYDPSTGRFISEDSNWGKDNDPLSLNLYTYCNNNPVMLCDANGHNPLLVTMAGGALIGALIGGGGNIANQLALNHGDWNSINWKDVGINATSGALSGALAGSGVGLIPAIIGNAAISGANYVAVQAVDGQSISNGDLAVNVGIGALAGFIGGKGAYSGDIKDSISAMAQAKLINVSGDVTAWQAREALKSAAVSNIIKTTLSTLVSNTGSDFLTYGSSGDSVSALQAILGVDADGKFGMQTKNALIKLQKQLGVSATGNFGNQTRAALRNLSQIDTTNQGISTDPNIR